MSMHLSKSKSLPAVILCCLLFSGVGSFAQAPGVPTARLSALLREYRDHVLSDTAYLKAVDSIAPMLGNDDSLPQRLAVYREIAFRDNIKGPWKARYYGYMALYFNNKSQFGSAIYYSEKNNEEKVKLGVFEMGGLPHSDLFAFSIDSSIRVYPRVISRYDKLCDRTLLRIPAAVAKGTVESRTEGISSADDPECGGVCIRQGKRQRTGGRRPSDRRKNAGSGKRGREIPGCLARVPLLLRFYGF